MKGCVSVAVAVASLVAVYVVSTSVEAGEGQCEVQDLKLQPSAYPLPMNLTVKPSETQWHLNFTLQRRGEEPDVYVIISGTADNIKLMHSEEDFENDAQLNITVWPKDLMQPGVWTKISIKVKGNAVHLTASIYNTVKIKLSNSPLSNIALQVTGAEKVTVVVLCQVNCTRSNHTSEWSGFQSKVGEWSQEKLHFYFSPKTESDEVHYEVACDKEVRRSIHLQPEDYAPELWHEVDLEQQNNTLKVDVDNKTLEIISLPDSCSTSNYKIWTDGDASYCFECDSKLVGEEVEPESTPGAEDTPSNVSPSEKIWEIIAGGIIAGVLILVVQ